ncbi:MAG: hypothetical protein AAFV95_10445 [Bacteroidota bacterium]
MGLGIEIALDNSPNAELSKASRVEVQHRMGSSSTYSLQFKEDVCENDFQLLRSRILDATSGHRLSILVPVEGGKECLVKGPLHQQRIFFQNGGAGSTLEVRGSDASILMGRQMRSRNWGSTTDSEVVQSIIGNYEGLTADVQATEVRHDENNRGLVQRQNDLRFIRRLSRRNAYQFWLSCDGNGQETAHFRRPALEGTPRVTLIINQANNNIDSLNLNWDSERPTSVQGQQHNLNDRQNTDGTASSSSQTSLGSRSFRQIASGDRSTSISAPAHSSSDLRSRSQAALLDAEWFIRASCQTTFERLCKIVRPFEVIQLDGAGSRHSGRYLVSGVRHIITAVGHQMELELIRNGWDD